MTRLASGLPIGFPPARTAIAFLALCGLVAGTSALASALLTGVMSGWSGSWIGPVAVLFNAALIARRIARALRPWIEAGRLHPDARFSQDP